MNEKVALITGSAKRVGAQVARTLHEQGWRVVIHYRGSKADAQQLVEDLNAKREDSARMLQADLSNIEAVKSLGEQAIAVWGRLDALVNNASSFYPTPLAEATLEDWDNLFASNAKAPFFLCQAVAPALKESHGAIVNMVDIHAKRPLKDFNIYGMAKAALLFLTKSLAKDLAPDVRVNAVAPGMIMWPEGEAAMDEKMKNAVIKRVPLRCEGKPQYIADAISFLLNQAYVTGQILAVDGGRSLNI